MDSARPIDVAQWFWTAMLPVSWTACWFLTYLSSSMISRDVPLNDKVVQSAIYLAVFTGLAGMIALRQLLAYGVENARWPRVAVLSTVLIAASVVATRYGLSA